MASDRQLAYMAAAEQSTAGDRNSRWGRLGQWLRRRRTRRDAARTLYLTLVEQARRPVFYATWGVPDSRDGRLEMVGLHAILVMRRLRSEGRPGRLLAQALFDLMFRDVDRHLREWGVGDLSVGQAGEEAGAQLPRPRQGARPVARRVRPGGSRGHAGAQRVHGDRWRHRRKVSPASPAIFAIRSVGWRLRTAAKCSPAT